VRVMPANATGWFWHCLARETGKIGHLLSPGAQRGPYPWLPYALDCGSFACWDQAKRYFDDSKWRRVEPEWLRLLEWARCNNQKPLWAIVPDVPGDWDRTWVRYGQKAGLLDDIPPAVAVQNGATVADVLRL
jgi:hypothetical protein